MIKQKKTVGRMKTYESVIMLRSHLGKYQKVKKETICVIKSDVKNDNFLDTQ